MSKPRCPKCYRSPAYYQEGLKCFLGYRADKMGRPYPKAEISDPGFPVDVLAICTCGHVWVLRGLKSIKEVRDLFKKGKS